MSLPLDIPNDPLLRNALAHIPPAGVLQACRDQLTDVDADTRRSWREARIIEALYHPARQAVVTYALLRDPNTPDRRMWPEADVIYLRTPLRKPMSRRGRVLSFGDTDFEVYRFPNDRRLRGLRKFTGAQDAIRIWQRWMDQSETPGTIIPSTLQRLLERYVPEQKWVARLRAEVTHNGAADPKKRRIAIRFASSESCRILRERHHMLTAASDHIGGFRVPKVVGEDIDLGALGVEWNRGKTLIEMLRQGAPDQVLAGLARALWSIHQSDASDLSTLTPMDQATNLHIIADELIYIRPELANRLQSVADETVSRLKRISNLETVTLHNDFHWNQVLIKHGVFTIIDLERMIMGDPLVDVSNFVTQIRTLSDRPELEVGPDESQQWSNAFLTHWQRQSNRSIDPDRFRSYAVYALINLAYGMMRHLRPGWSALLDRCLERAEGMLVCDVREVTV